MRRTGSFLCCRASILVVQRTETFYLARPPHPKSTKGSTMWPTLPALVGSLWERLPTGLRLLELNLGPEALHASDEYLFNP
jgi:hypothetical protein